MIWVVFLVGLGLWRGIGWDFSMLWGFLMDEGSCSVLYGGFVLGDFVFVFIVGYVFVFVWLSRVCFVLFFICGILCGWCLGGGICVD